MNDNGTAVTTVRGQTYNHYQISFQYNDVVDGNNDDETISIRVSVKDQAGEYYTNETRCSKINQNDVLGDIIIYDEFNMFQRRMYQVMIHRPDGTYDLMGVANYDMHTNRMIYDDANRPEGTPEVCLSNIEEIIFTSIVA